MATLGHMSNYKVSESMFEPSALAALFELSAGVPRRINRLCDLSLLIGCADSLRSISADEVEAVAGELVAVAPD